MVNLAEQAEELGCESWKHVKCRTKFSLRLAASAISGVELDFEEVEF